jgi:hypothetical protein
LRAAYRTQIDRAPAVALLYARGQQSFTLFQGRSAGLPQGWNGRRLAVRQRAVGGVTFTVVGPLPEAELDRVLNSVQLNTPAGEPGEARQRPPNVIPRAIPRPRGPRPQSQPNTRRRRP